MRGTVQAAAKRRRTRSGLVAASLCVAALTFGACGSDGDEEPSGDSGSGGGIEEISFVQPVPGEGSLFFYPYLVGEELGFFEDEGVQIEYLAGSPDLPLPAFVANGDADVGAIGAEETLAAVAKGGDLTAVYEDAHVGADVISVLEDSDIQSVVDLEGESVGVNAQEDRGVLEVALDLAGVDPSSVQITNIGAGGPNVAKALEQGTIAAYVAGPVDQSVTEILGEFTLRDIIPEELEARPTGFVVRPETLEQRREALVGLMRAWSMASYVGQVKPEIAAAIARERVPQEWENEAIAESNFELAASWRVSGGEPYGALSTDAWSGTQDLLVETGVLQGDAVDLDALLNDELISEIDDFDRAEVEAAADAWADRKEEE